MKVDHFSLTSGEISYFKQSIHTPNEASFVLVFANRKQLEAASWIHHLEQQYVETPIVSCSSSGLIYQDTIDEDLISGIAVQFEKTKIQVNTANLSDHTDSLTLGIELGKMLDSKDLTHVLLFSDGWLVNGTELLQGLHQMIPTNVTVSGGFAGDGDHFSHTLVGVNQEIQRGKVVAIGMYGSQLKVGYGKHGGWSELGEVLTVTKTNNREILELNNKSALNHYKEFLGNDADGLPGKALMYPLSVNLPSFEQPLVRTVFNCDDLEGSLSLGEPIPVGSKVQFMRAQFNDVLQGVELAAKNALKAHDSTPDFALIVSCIGRKLLLGKRIEEEIAITQQALGNTSIVTGFYSNGEICMDEKELAEIHHQYLTVTTYLEQ